jgi:hypothetical protein
MGHTPVNRKLRIRKRAVTKPRGGATAARSAVAKPRARGARGNPKPPSRAAPRRAATQRTDVASPLHVITRILRDTSHTPHSRAELAGSVLQQTADTDLSVQKKCFLTLYGFQTPEEVSRKTTLDRNSRGFDSFDGPRCSKLGERLKQNPFGSLSSAEAALLSRMVTKYRAQIVTKSSPAQLKDILLMPLSEFCDAEVPATAADDGLDQKHDHDYVLDEEEEEEEDDEESDGDGDDDAFDSEDDPEDAEDDPDAEDGSDGDDDEVEDADAAIAGGVAAPLHQTHQTGGPAAGAGTASPPPQWGTLYSIPAAVLTRAGEDIYTSALAEGATTAEAIFEHFSGAPGVTLHDIHTRLYVFWSAHAQVDVDAGSTLVVYRDGTWTRGVVEKATVSSLFVKVSDTTRFWICRKPEMYYTTHVPQLGLNG